jgi:hypothetical protein
MKKMFGIFAITMLLTGFQLHAQGDLLITPKRIIFENNKQKEEINLVNIGKDTATYSISFVQYNMNENGSFTNIQKPDSGQMFADPFLRVFPRKITLAPREAQVLSLQCRRNANMVVGEYRSHLYFRSEKNNKPLGMDNNTGSDTSTLKIQLTPIFGLSIPVIIRAGNVTVSSSLTNLKLETLPDFTQTLNMTITRAGNSSIYGDIVVQFFPIKGKPVDVGRLNSVSVYTNINKRHISVKLKNIIINNILTPGKLKVQYINKNENNTVVHAQQELDIN